MEYWTFNARFVTGSPDREVSTPAYCTGNTSTCSAAGTATSRSKTSGATISVSWELSCLLNLLTFFQLAFSADNVWEQLRASGDPPGCLQEHTMVGYRDELYVFGGEVGFSNGVETPLWIYSIKV